MPTFPLRIRFVDERVANELFASFPTANLDYLEGWSRKRDGDSQVLLLRVSDEQHLHEFLALCRESPDVVEVGPITEEEFWRAPSNAVE